MLKRILRYGHWQLGRLVQALDRDENMYHKESVKFQQLMVANNEQAFQQMYSDPGLLQHYLVDSRLGFFRTVADKVRGSYRGDVASAACVDVGCGTGHLLAELRKRGFAGRLVGMDTAASAGACVKSHGMGLEFLHGHLSPQGWRQVFDLALCTEVLEHCDYPDRIIRDMFEVVRPGGTIIITVPDGRKDAWEGHIHFWSPESFRLFMGSFGREVEFDYFENSNYCAIRC